MEENSEQEDANNNEDEQKFNAKTRERLWLHFWGLSRNSFLGFVVEQLLGFLLSS
jgi:hypothetical protein